VICANTDQGTLDDARESGAALDALLAAAGIESNVAIARLLDEIYRTGNFWLIEKLA